MFLQIRRHKYTYTLTLLLLLLLRHQAYRCLHFDMGWDGKPHLVVVLVVVELAVEVAVVLVEVVLLLVGGH